MRLSTFSALRRDLEQLIHTPTVVIQPFTLASNQHLKNHMDIYTTYIEKLNVYPHHLIILCTHVSLLFILTCAVLCGRGNKRFIFIFINGPQG